MENGELEIGQVASMVGSVEPVADIMSRLLSEYAATLSALRD